MDIIKNADAPNRKGRIPSRCKNCNNLITRNSGYKAIFCSIKCQHELQNNTKYIKWLNGDTKVWKSVKSFKQAVIRKDGYICIVCKITEWNSKPIVLELEHKDGNSLNNKFNNLCLLCPNCHSQTDTFKSKNKGNGRHSRRLRYATGQSF